MPYSYRNPRPQVATDCVVLAAAEGTLRVLLVQRDSAPFAGAWALPGRILREGESLEDSARRAVARAGIGDVFMEPLYTFGEPDRDPSARTISVAYYALVPPEVMQVELGEKARAIRWAPVGRLPRLAFDHRKILRAALERLRGKIRHQPIGFELLPERFKLAELRDLYATILGQPVDDRTFRRKLLAMGGGDRPLLVPLDEHETGVGRRAARFYRFDRARYRELARGGFNFEL